MHLLGIPLRKPSFDDITAGSVLACGLWVLAVGLSQALQWPLGRDDAGALLAVMVASALAPRCGIRIDQGPRHLLANALLSALVLGIYQGALALGQGAVPA